MNEQAERVIAIDEKRNTGTVVEKCRVYGDLRANFIPRRKHLDSGWFNAIT